MFVIDLILTPSCLLGQLLLSNWSGMFITSWKDMNHLNRYAMSYRLIFLEQY